MWRAKARKSSRPNLLRLCKAKPRPGCGGNPKATAVSVNKQLEESKKQLQAADGKREAELMAQKQKIAAEQEHQRKTLQPLQKDEAKDRWLAEKKLANLDEKAKQLEEEKAALGAKKQAMAQKSADVASQLESIPATPAAPEKRRKSPRAR